MTETCDHVYALGGLCYRHADHPMLGTGAHARYYSDWYYCTKCLARTYNNERQIGNSYEKPLPGATPR